MILKYSLNLSGKRDEIFELENFISSIPSLSCEIRDKLRIIASETFDNIIAHSEKLSGSIHVCVYPSPHPTLFFLYRSINFNILINNPDRNIYYDPRQNRYRGLGISMCYRLSQSLQYRITRDYNAIRFVV